MKGIKTIFILITIAAILILIAISIYGIQENGIRHVNRYLARFNFIIFIFIFISSSLNSILQTSLTTQLMKLRSHLWIAFTSIMFLRILTIIAFYQIVLIAPQEILISIGRGLGLFLALTMALTTNQYSIDLFGEKVWKMIHNVGIYGLWFIYAFTFIGRVSISRGYIPIACIPFIILIIRVIGKVVGKKKNIHNDNIA